jgi:hypothetical protein
MWCPELLHRVSNDARFLHRRVRNMANFYLFNGAVNVSMELYILRFVVKLHLALIRRITRAGLCPWDNRGKAKLAPPPQFIKI